MSPLKSFRCSICGKSVPKRFLEEGMFEERMEWLRKHYSDKHPGKFGSGK